MNACLGGVIFPYFPELLTAQDQAALHPTVANMEAAAQALQRNQPQAVVILTPQGAMLDNVISMHNQPRLRGSFSNGQGNQQVLGFETEQVLMRAIAKQSERLGIPIQAITPELQAQYGWRDGLASEAMVPLYYLFKSGFNKQIVHLNYGKLPYEEMYTLGKAVQIAMQQFGKKTALVVASQLAMIKTTSEFEWNQAVIASLAKRDVKSLLELAERKPNSMATADLRALFFCLGGLSKLAFTWQTLQYTEYASKGQVVALFV